MYQNHLLWIIFRVGIDLPTIEVRFEHLNIEAEAFVGNNALPTVLNFTTGIVEVAIWKILVTLSFYSFCFRILSHVSFCIVIQGLLD